MAEKGTVVCRCEEVQREEILRAIAEGARTMNEVKKRTRAGMGLCQGRTCQRLISRILAEQTGRPLGEILPPTSRPPVRPIPLGAFAAAKAEGDDAA